MSRKGRISTPVTKTFATRLEDLINETKKTGYTQKEIAAKIGVSSGSLSEWSSDQVTATIDNLVQIAEYFGVSTDYLLGLSATKSTDTNIREICLKTGLSERAIESLLLANSCAKAEGTIDTGLYVVEEAEKNTLNNVDMCKLLFFSELIEKVNFWEIYSTFQRIHDITLSDSLETFYKVVKTETGATYSTGHEIIDFLKYQATTELKKIVEDFFNDYFIDGKRW